MNRTSSLVLVPVGLNLIMLVTLYVVLGDALQGQALPFFGIGVVFTLILAGVLVAAVPAATDETAEAAGPAASDTPEPASPAAALQVLSLLQRKGRLLDFLKEDIQQYQDAQIGAAVRTVHEGCKEALDEILELQPVMHDAEGSTVTVESGFDAEAIRLIGNVQGDPPFTGALRHRGWRVARIDLPERMKETDDVVAAAEVEVS
jgi:hypothetical protein